jgi:hypothetical protein
MLVLRIFVHGDICDAVSPLAWVGPEDGNSDEGTLGLPGPCMESHVSDPVSRPAKKQATESSLYKDAV